MGRALRTCVILMVASVLVAGCTVKKSTPPPLAGPSELGLSLSLGAIPDVVSQDGQARSVITISARDAGGSPVQGLTLRLDITVGGALGDVGTLSSKSPVTGTDGRATVTYTAPLVIDQTSRIVAVLATPVGTNYANATSRSVDIRLVPPGTVLPPNDLLAGFTVTPASPTAAESVLFNAADCRTVDEEGCSSGPIVSYAWNFGDGAQGSGQVTSHAFARAGNYAVTLTLTGALGQTASTTQIVQVAGGTAPTADFVFSPTSPVVSQEVFFNASASKAGTGRTIVSYEWDFGSGGAWSGVTVRTTYAAAGTYVVTLVVTDDIGQKGTKSQSVTIR